MEFVPNIRHLHAILEIARTGSISAAAKSVHLSQPAISQSLAKIERHLGTPLFERGATGMFVTAAGEVYLRRAARAQEVLRSIDKDLSDRPSARPLYQLFTTAQLRAVIATVEQASLSLAAVTLKLAQPTVHRSAREAEQICGHPLFIRSANGVDPTALARRLARVASIVFAELRQGYEEVDEHLGHMRGKLSIGSLPLARTQLVPASVTELLDQYPQAEVSIIDGPYGQLLDGLLHGHIDLIVGALRHPLPVRDIIQELLFDDPLAVVVRANHPLIKALKKNKQKMQLTLLTKLDWIAPRRETPARSRFHELFAKNGLTPPRQVIECSSSVATRGLLLQSDRAALLSARQVQTELQSKVLATLPIALNTSRPIGLTLRKHWQPTKIQSKFIEVIKLYATHYSVPKTS